MGEMEDAVRALILRHAFRRGRADATRIAADFAVPLIAYHQDGIILFRTRDEVASAVEAYFARLQRNGVDHVDPQVLSIVPGGPDRVSALVDWRHVAAEGRILGVNRSRAFFRRMNGQSQPKIELVEYLSLETRSIFADGVPVSRGVH
jgi:hypothetical protein